MTALQTRLREAEPWQAVTERDLSYLRVGDDDVLVVACDSDGGIGPKPHDTVAVSGYDLGRSAARVPLLEVVAAGARPVLVVDTLAVERHPTGDEILAGVLAEAALGGLGPEAVTGSTEDNVATVATGVGVTVLGRATIDALRPGSAATPYVVVLLGRPMSAPAQRFGPDHPDILSLPAMATAMATPRVLEALPIGSRGVGYEYDQLTATGGRREPFDRWPVAPEQSGGPSTAALLAVEPTQLDETCDTLRGTTGLPVWPLGHVR